MSEPTPVSVSLKYGIPGVLITSGVALLAISVVHATLLPVGMAVLLIGILTYIGKQAFGVIGDAMDELDRRNLETSEWALLVGFVLGALVLAIVLVWLFLPFLPQ